MSDTCENTWAGLYRCTNNNLMALNKTKIVQSGGHDCIGFTNIIIHVLTGLSIIMSITVSKAAAKHHKT